jgi:hypothetical protein
MERMAGIKAMKTKIILPHSGYKKLIVYKKSDIIYQGTVVFCRRFLPQYGDRTVDQMTQAARSCKQNIAEGSAAEKTERVVRHMKVTLTSFSCKRGLPADKTGNGGGLCLTAVRCRIHIGTNRCAVRYKLEIVCQ